MIHGIPQRFRREITHCTTLYDAIEIMSSFQGNPHFFTKKLLLSLESRPVCTSICEDRVLAKFQIRIVPEILEADSKYSLMFTQLPPIFAIIFH